MASKEDTAERPTPPRPEEPGDEERYAPGDEKGHSPLLILFGLVVVWGSLYLVAIAQNISYEPPSGPETTENPSLSNRGALRDERPVEAESLLTRVESLNLKEVPARQIVKDLLYKAHLHVSKEELNKVSSDVRNLHFEQKPLYECLHSALGEDELSLMIVDDRVHFISGKLTHAIPSTGPLDQFVWETTVSLGGRPVIFFPTGRSSYWIELKKLRSADQASAGTRIAFAIYEAETLTSSGESLLPPPGSGAVRMVSGNTLSLRIEQKVDSDSENQTASDTTPVGIRFQYQSPITAESVPLEEG